MKRRHPAAGRRVAAAIAVLAASVTLAGQRGGPPPAAGRPQNPPPAGRGAISGVVIDGATLQPVAGAVVFLSSSARGAQPDPARVTTDSQGRYVFTRLPAASYALNGYKHGYVTGRFGDGDATTSAANRAIQLADGQWFSSGRIVMWRTGAISGTITDETGEPQVGVLVRVFARVILGGRPQLAAGASAKTDDLGRYRVSGLAPGTYVVFVPSVQAAVPGEITLAELAGYTPQSMMTAEAAGRVLTPPDPIAIAADPTTRLIAGTYPTPPPASTGRWVYPPLFYPNARTIGEALAIDMRRGEQRSGVDMRLAPVRSVTVRGVVQGPAGAATDRLTIRLLPSGNEGLGFGSETATSLVRSDGSFTLLNIPSGQYTVVVARTAMEYMTSTGSLYAAATPPGCSGGGSGFFSLGNGPESLRASYRSCGGGDDSFTARMPLAVADSDMTGITVPLVRAVTLSGRLIHDGDPPAADSPAARIGARLFAEPANGDSLLGLLNSGSSQGDRTQFRITGLLPGAYVLQSAGIGGQIKSIEWQGRDYAGRPFDTTSGRDIENVVVTLTNASTRIRGNVRDAQGGAASAGVVVAFPTDRTLWTNYGLRPAHLQSAQLTTAGAYSLVLPAGEYFVIALESADAMAWVDPRFLGAAAASAARVRVAWGETAAQDLAITAVKVTR
jgi:hypothetical protein